ncbi:MAG: DUF1559 family PulG-like putative transporter [Planctomycetota bacterium]|jgi:prepilin-type processing-associated H-X9-DG protein
MQTKRKVKWVLLLMFCYFVGLNSFASGASTGLDQVLGPCIDDQTFAVAHLDLEKLDLDAYVDKVLSLVAGPDTAKQEPDDLKNFQAMAGARFNELLKAGCRDIFLVFSMNDFPFFFVAVPIHSTSDQNRLRQQVQKITKDFNVGEIELHVSDGLILVGLKRTIARLKTVSPVRSQALAAGFEACANKTAQVVLFPSSDQRRILAEMLPEIPSESGNIKFTTLSKDLEWAALGLDGPPSISLNLTIQSANTDGADRMLTFIKNLYALAGHYNEARPLIPELDQVLKWLTPRKHGKRLLLEIDSTTADTIINDFVAPSMVKARVQARRAACKSNLKIIGMALLMYSNDNKDKFPADLETLVTKTYLRENKMLICPADKLRDSYIYRGASMTVADTPWIITVYEKSGNHEGGRNVLFMDGSAEWVSEERFQELIKKDNEYRRKKGFVVLPAQ